jgi:hypothetical protein
MSSEKRERDAAEASKRPRSRPEGLVQKLAEDFLAKLSGSWRQHGPETLTRLSTERPEVYVKAMVNLAVAQLAGCDKLSDLDRQRNREQALHRLERAEAVVRKPFPRSAFRRGS